MNDWSKMKVMRRRAVRHSWLLRGVIASPRPGWHEFATCKGRDLRTVTPAICQTCPVRLDCLASALVEEAHDPESYCCRGGIPAAQRTEFIAQLRALRPVIEHGTDRGYHAELRLVRQGLLDRTCDACRASHNATVGNGAQQRQRRRERSMEPLAGVS